MSQNGPDISIVINSDPTWTSMDASAARLNKPDFGQLLRSRSPYRIGGEYKKAKLIRISEKLAAIHNGLADTEPQKPSPQKSTNQEAIDFDSPHGMITNIKDKAKALPVRSVFTPILTGCSQPDPTAIDFWRNTISSIVGNIKPTLDRGISR